MLDLIALLGRLIRIRLQDIRMMHHLANSLNHSRDGYLAVALEKPNQSVPGLCNAFTFILAFHHSSPSCQEVAAGVGLVRAYKLNIPSCEYVKDF